MTNEIEKVYIYAFRPKSIRIHKLENYDLSETVASIAINKKYLSRLSVIQKAFNVLYQDLETKKIKPSEVILFNSEEKSFILML